MTAHEGCHVWLTLVGEEAPDLRLDLPVECSTKIRLDGTHALLRGRKRSATSEGEAHSVFVALKRALRAGLILYRKIRADLITSDLSVIKHLHRVLRLSTNRVRVSVVMLKPNFNIAVVQLVVEITSTSSFLETPSVLKLAGIPYSTLDYWVRTGLVTPSVRAGEGRRRVRLWSVADAVAVRALKHLRDAGAPVRLLAKARKTLAADWTPALSAQMLFWDGADLLQLDEWKNLLSLIKEPGQGALHVVALPLEVFTRDAEAAIVRLPVGGSASGNDARDGAA